jgi:glycosyltransferase involved in cell wall biosynthesis
LQPDVTLVSPFPPPGAVHDGFSGVASYTANLARALVDRGATVQVVADHLDGEADTAPSMHVEHDGRLIVRRAFRRGRRALLDAASAAVEAGAPVTHVQLEMFLYGGPASLTGLPLALARLRAAGQGPVVTLHQVLDPATIDRATVDLHRVSVPAPLARLGVSGLHQAVGRLAATTIVHEGPFAELVPGSVVVPHGMEVRDRPDHDAARRHLEIDHDRLTVLCFGFLAPYKGLELVLEAGELAADVAQVVVAGGEHPRLAGRDDYADALRARHRHHARFTGWVPEAHVGSWFAAADLAAYPYPKPFAASGSVALALAHRTPVLLSPGLARFMGAPSDLVLPTDPDELAGSFRRLAAERRHLDALARWSETLAAGRTWPEVADRHLSIYQEVTHGPDPSRRRLRAAQPG